MHIVSALPICCALAVGDEPYWSLAEELDIPVGIHIGPGPAGGPRVWQQNNYRTALTDPTLLEPVLNGHPRLRVYVMHAG